MEYSKQRAYLWLIVPSLVVSFLAFAYPIYVIRPFRRQGPRELAAALAVIQIRPTVEIIALPSRSSGSCGACALSRRVPAGSGPWPEHLSFASSPSSPT